MKVLKGIVIDHRQEKKRILIDIKDKADSDHYTILENMYLNDYNSTSILVSG
jgi:hypothetical protein